mmetsp:Transcript_101067/g.231832  ORF Transcript_101067/g.231832 Transcript_101067/m.231832 type:complete len:569 (+) Transcript_101067:55-1761(+)
MPCAVASAQLELSNVEKMALCARRRARPVTTLATTGAPITTIDRRAQRRARQSVRTAEEAGYDLDQLVALQQVWRNKRTAAGVPAGAPAAGPAGAPAPQQSTLDLAMQRWEEVDNVEVAGQFKQHAVGAPMEDVREACLMEWARETGVLSRATAEVVAEAFEQSWQEVHETMEAIAAKHPLSTSFSISDPDSEDSPKLADTLDARAAEACVSPADQGSPTTSEGATPARGGAGVRAMIGKMEQQIATQQGRDKLCGTESGSGRWRKSARLTAGSEEARPEGARPEGAPPEKAGQQEATPNQWGTPPSSSSWVVVIDDGGDGTSALDCMAATAWKGCSAAGGSAGSEAGADHRGQEGPEQEQQEERVGQQQVANGQEEQVGQQQVDHEQEEQVGQQQVDHEQEEQVGQQQVDHEQKEQHQHQQWYSDAGATTARPEQNGQSAVVLQPAPPGHPSAALEESAPSADNTQAHPDDALAVFYPNGDPRANRTRRTRKSRDSQPKKHREAVCCKVVSEFCAWWEDDEGVRDAEETAANLKSEVDCEEMWDAPKATKAAKGWIFRKLARVRSLW